MILIRLGRWFGLTVISAIWVGVLIGHSNGLQLWTKSETLVNERLDDSMDFS